MMHRNLDRRVEALVRLTSPDHLREISEMFDLAMDDNTMSWTLGPEGDWVRRSIDDAGNPLVDLQDVVMKQITKRRKRSGITR
jgi:polyphosphate kinase